MSYSLQFQQSQRQMQHLMATQKMQQAIHFLQLPSQELTAAINQELEQNPLLEPLEGALYDEEDLFLFKRMKGKKQTFVENTLYHSPSLFEHLMQQAKQSLCEPEELHLAELIIGNLDERGFLTQDLREVAFFAPLEKLQSVLQTIQTFEPLGVAATSVQESLLIQLRGKEHTLAYTLVDKHFDDVLKNRIPCIEKSLHISSEEIVGTIKKEIARLDLSPGANFSQHLVPYIKPDLAILQMGDELVVEVDDDFLPPVGFNKKYLQLLEDPNVSEEDKNFVKEKIAAAKWLVRSVDQRNRTLTRIAKELVVRQRAFFLSLEGQLTPLTMKEVAEQLEVHESTVARAVANKYLDCPRGVFPLRYFFTQSYTTESGEEISSRTVKEALLALVNSEEKGSPLSDEKLSKLLQEQGIACARRTVAKYRRELNIGTAKQRKQF